MTQAELDREVSRATGETVPEIQRRGFSLLEPLPDEPLMIDWETPDDLRIHRLLRHRRRRQRQAA